MDNYDEKLAYVWGSVGFIIHLSQLIEYNLANILAGDVFLKDINLQEKMGLKEYRRRAFKSNKKLKSVKNDTMTRLINMCHDASIFDERLQNDLEQIKNNRDYYVHHYFKDQLFSRDIDINPESLFDDLSSAVQMFKEMNEKLLKIDMDQRDKAMSIDKY